MEEAGAKARELNERPTMTNVKYTAKEYNSGENE
jgi:hypothetical protein